MSNKNAKPSKPKRFAKRRINVYLIVSQIDELRRESDKTGLSVAHIIRDAITCRGRCKVCGGNNVRL